MSGKVKVWGNMVTVEWADPMEDPDPEVMAKVGAGAGAGAGLFPVGAGADSAGAVGPAGQGAVCEEPGQQRDRGDPGEGLQRVRQPGAGEEAQRLRLHPL